MALMNLDVILAGPGLYRSPQPQLEHLLQLREQGLSTLVNLRAESDESRWYCERAGVGYHWIPVTDWTCPTADQVQEFLDMMEDVARRPILVHCWGGVGRTGLFVSCWRVGKGMPAEDAILLSDQETPWMGMNDLQRQFVRDFEATVRPRRL